MRDLETNLVPLNDAKIQNINTFDTYGTYNSLKKDLLEDVKSEITSIVKTEFIKLKDEFSIADINITPYEYNMKYENELLSKEIQSKNMILDILNKLLNTLQEVTKNITSAAGAHERVQERVYVNPTILAQVRQLTTFIQS